MSYVGLLVLLGLEWACYIARCTACHVTWSSLWLTVTCMSDTRRSWRLCLWVTVTTGRQWLIAFIGNLLMSLRAVRWSDGYVLFVVCLSVCVCGRTGPTWRVLLLHLAVHAAVFVLDVIDTCLTTPSSFSLCVVIIHGGLKTGSFLKCITPVYDEVVGRRSIYQNVRLFIRSKTGILNVAIYKYSLLRFRERTLHRKYQVI